MTCFNECVALVKIYKKGGGGENEILVLFESTCFLNDPVFY